MDTQAVPKAQQEPVFNIPGSVLAMLAILAAVHLVRSLLSDDTDTRVVLTLAFIADRYDAQGLDWPGGLMAAWASPVTHMAVHGDLTHLALNAASLAAFGGLVARRIGAIRFWLFTIVCGVAGALTFAVFNLGSQAPLIGASGAIAGMMAASLRILFSAIDQFPNRLAGTVLKIAPQRIALKPLMAALSDRRMIIATGMWLFINLLAGFGLGMPEHTGTVAWEAHLGGYFAGLLAFQLFDIPRFEATEDSDLLPPSTSTIDEPNQS